MKVSERGLDWYTNAKFGMFVHWGVYSLLECGEWALFTERHRVSEEEYAALAPKFEAARFDADEWMRTAASAGQAYLTITTRHHDGFSMYDTALSTEKVTATPFARDPLAELAAAGQRHGVKLGCYVSLLDWRHPAYRASKREKSSLAWDDYIGFLHGQVRELCTNYGPLAQIWFDGDWPDSPVPEGEDEWFLPGGDFDYPALYGMIHQLQPDAVVANNRHCDPLPGEDVQIFEQGLPSDNPTGFNLVPPRGGPLEVAMTMNNSWGYNASDENGYRSVDELRDLLARAGAVGANLLLNVGPTPEGEIPAPARRRLAELGSRSRG